MYFFPNLTHGTDNFIGKYKSPKLPQERGIKIEQTEQHSRNFKSQRYTHHPFQKFLMCMSILKTESIFP